MDLTILIVFGFVYLGMILGEIPGLALDRTGVALLGAIALLAAGRVSPEAAWEAVDVPTLALLFGLMVLSAQFRLGGFYALVTRRIAAAPVPPQALLALVVAASGVLSAFLANDIVCLAMAPLLVEGCARRRLDPVPFLAALACASNVGSAATLIGNPQNMLIGQVLGLSFTRYLIDAGVPSLLGLGAVWWVVCLAARGRWERATPPWTDDAAAGISAPAGGPAPGGLSIPEVAAPPFNVWQTAKGLGVLLALLGLFCFSPWPREVAALGAAGLLLTSRRMASRDILGLVDWHLLVLFMGLFVVNHALAESGMAAAALRDLAFAGLDVSHPGWLFAVTVALSNLVSNVPAVMLLLPAATHPLAGALLALASTLAGNLLIVGSIANIIVVDQAGRLGVRIGWREHARYGVPVTAITLALAALWLWLLSAAGA
jgi:Na+/H+ antiporter NhaD/arsenite permease-like protein